MAFIFGFLSVLFGALGILGFLAMKGKDDPRWINTVFIIAIWLALMAGVTR